MDEMIVLIESDVKKNKQQKKSADQQIIISLATASRILHITQSLSQRSGHVILIGVAGSGRRSCVRLSTLLLNYQLYQVQ